MPGKVLRTQRRRSVSNSSAHKTDCIVHSGSRPSFGQGPPVADTIGISLSIGYCRTSGISIPLHRSTATLFTFSTTFCLIIPVPLLSHSLPFFRYHLILRQHCIFLVLVMPSMMPQQCLMCVISPSLDPSCNRIVSCFFLRPAHTTLFR